MGISNDVTNYLNIDNCIASDESLLCYLWQLCHRVVLLWDVLIRAIVYITEVGLISNQTILVLKKNIKIFNVLEFELTSHGNRVRFDH